MSNSAIMGLKKLGQHFLINKNKLRKIVEAADLKPGDAIIEIGPGHGELTGELVNWLISELEKGKNKLFLIEKDFSLAESLKDKYAQYEKIEVVVGDVLKILPNLINRLTNKQINYKLVGNIPYYITGHLLRIIGELKNKPKLVIFTIQKEVAERVCAESPKMNLLAASVQFWAEPKIIGFISKKDFRPAPKVDSAIIRLKPFGDTITRESIKWGGKRKKEERDGKEGKYYQLIKILFKQPRKTILNNLATAIKDKEEIAKKLRQLNLNPQARPQDLTIEQLVELSTFF